MHENQDFIIQTMHNEKAFVLANGRPGYITVENHAGTLSRWASVVLRWCDL